MLGLHLAASKEHPRQCSPCVWDHGRVRKQRPHPLMGTKVGKWCESRGGCSGLLVHSSVGPLPPPLHPFPEHPCFGLGKGQLPNGLCLS